METKEKTKFIKGEYYIASIQNGVCIVKHDGITNGERGLFSGICVFSNDSLNKKGDTGSNWDMTSFSQLTNFKETDLGNIHITIDGLCDDVSMYECCWNDLSINQKVYCKYTNGRILNSLYIKKVYLKK